MIRNHVLTMNIKSTKMHEYTTTKIMLDFESKYVHLNVESLILSNLKYAKNALSSYQYQLFVTLRNESKLLLSEIFLYTHEYS